MLFMQVLETIGGFWLAISAVVLTFGALGSASLLAIAGLGALGALVILTKPAKAGGLGPDCCADLEERVDELEATTLRKGNREVSVQLYGKANKAVLIWDDGAKTDTYIVDNYYESSRFGIIGSAKIGGDWSAGFRVEAENRLGASTLADQFRVSDPEMSSPRIRWSSMYINNKELGEFRWGLTATPKYDITKDTNVFSPNLIDTTSSDNRMNQSFFLRAKGFDGDRGLSSLTWSNIGRCYGSSEAFNCSTRRLGFAYWSPNWQGFSASAGLFEDNDWSVAMRYKKNWGDRFLVGAGIGYENFRELATRRDFDEWAGLANIKHVPTGLFAFTAFGFSSNDTNAQGIFTKKGPPEMNAWDVQVGIQRKMPWLRLDRLGETSFWGGFSNIHDGIAQGGSGKIPANGFLPRGTFANVPVDTQITGSDVDRWFVAADQWVESAAIQLYAVYQHLDAEIDLVDEDVMHVPAPLDNFDVFYTGTIIYF